ncbi:MAG: septal ring lytic transglycosylase RlpA family protein [Gammaproteobacteria bacterium]|nr:MAG: septal ring lytic transglycosylase RlpA family protein [Gammaproteobacteria bacterium]
MIHQLRATLLLGVLLLSVACTSSRDSGPEADRGPRETHPELAALPDPIPRVEPHSRYGNHSPYVVFGKTYRVMDDPRDYSATGRASWYGLKFQDRPTSSGEPYDMFALTAAHRSLPLPSYLRVTNLQNGRSTVVRVNDRGPFHDERIIDLSYAAAVKLDFVDAGTARVHVELLQPEPLLRERVPEPAPVPMEPPPRQPDGAEPVAANLAANLATDGAIFLQAGAFLKREGAERLHDDLTPLVGPTVHIDRSADDYLFRVRIGPVAHMREATRLQALIVTAQLGMPLIVRESR